MGTDREGSESSRIDLIALAVALKSAKRLSGGGAVLRWSSECVQDDKRSHGELFRTADGLFVCTIVDGKREIQPVLSVSDLLNTVQDLIENGIAKVSGRSAFEIAQDHGFDGTQEQWLASLRGESGKSVSVSEVWGQIRSWLTENVELLRGKPGADCPPISDDVLNDRVSDAVSRYLHLNPPAAGKDASDQQVQRSVEKFLKHWIGKNPDALTASRKEVGIPGPTGPMPKHEWKGTSIRFEMEAGKWGKWVDLQGLPGNTLFLNENSSSISEQQVFLGEPLTAPAVPSVSFSESAYAGLYMMKVNVPA